MKFIKYVPSNIIINSYGTGRGMVVSTLKFRSLYVNADPPPKKGLGGGELKSSLFVGNVREGKIASMKRKGQQTSAVALCAACHSQARAGVVQFFSVRAEDCSRY